MNNILKEFINEYKYQYNNLLNYIKINNKINSYQYNILIKIKKQQNINILKNMYSDLIKNNKNIKYLLNNEIKYFHVINKEINIEYKYKEKFTTILLINNELNYLINKERIRGMVEYIQKYLNDNKNIINKINVIQKLKNLPLLFDVIEDEDISIINVVYNKDYHIELQVVYLERYVRNAIIVYLYDCNFKDLKKYNNNLYNYFKSLKDIDLESNKYIYINLSIKTTKDIFKFFISLYK